MKHKGKPMTNTTQLPENDDFMAKIKAKAQLTHPDGIITETWTNYVDRRILQIQQATLEINQHQVRIEKLHREIQTAWPMVQENFSDLMTYFDTGLEINMLKDKLK